MRLRNITGSREMIAENSFCIHEPEKMKGKWKKDIFNNDNPVHIEIGSGKGRFITEIALKRCDIDYVGIEKYSSVLLRAVKKLGSMESAPENLVFIRMDAEYITDVFDSEEVDLIYLNFSDPWPKARHSKRRLPSAAFLDRYDRILKKDGHIEFKTDNRDLFDFAIDEAKAAGWKIDKVSYDLHNDDEMMRDNVMTEYEEKFSSAGNPIFKYIISR